MPPNTAFVDLLIKETENDPNYCQMNHIEIMTFDGQIIVPNSEMEIVSYKDEDGFVSCTIHNTNAKTTLFESYDEEYYLFFGDDYITLRQHYEEVKLAYISQNGSVLSVSNSVSIMDKGLFVDFGELLLKGTVLTRQEITDWYLIILLFFCSLILLVICSFFISTISKKRKKKLHTTV
jgi:hypothetical protein